MKKEQVAISLKVQNWNLSLSEQVDVDNFFRENLDSPVDRAWSKTFLNSHAVAMSRNGHCPFMSFFRPFPITESSRGKIVIPRTYIFTTFIFSKFFSLISFHWEKNHFSQAVSWNSPKYRILAAVKVWTDGETLWNLYVMMKRSLRI